MRGCGAMSGAGWSCLWTARACCVRRGREEACTVDSDWLIYHELVEGGGRRFMRCVSCVDPAWLLELAPHYYQQKTQHRASAADDGGGGQSSSEHGAVKHRRIF